MTAHKKETSTPTAPSAQQIKGVNMKSYQEFCSHYGYAYNAVESKGLYAEYKKQLEIFSAISAKD